jgi:hypothetical protein
MSSTIFLIPTTIESNERFILQEKNIMELKRRPGIAGKVVIVTGASSGIGESTARESAQAGAITVLAARRRERLKRLQHEIEEMGGVTLAVPTDLTASNRSQIWFKRRSRGSGGSMF